MGRKLSLVSTKFAFSFQNSHDKEYPLLHLSKFFFMPFPRQLPFDQHIYSIENSPSLQSSLNPQATRGKKYQLTAYRLLLPTGDLDKEEVFLLRLTGERLTGSAPLLRLAGGERDEEGLRPLRRTGERLTGSAARLLCRGGGERDLELEYERARRRGGGELEEE